MNKLSLFLRRVVKWYDDIDDWAAKPAERAGGGAKEKKFYKGTDLEVIGMDSVRAQALDDVLDLLDSAIDELEQQRKESIVLDIDTPGGAALLSSLTAAKDAVKEVRTHVRMMRND